MTPSHEHRLIIDEVETDQDGRKIATLVTASGGIVTMPVSLLPDGARVNQVIVASFQIDTDSTEKRKRRVRALQHRLFDRDSEA